MRPLTLVFSGIRSYPGEVKIDFTGKHLVGILGDTGAGKTTIFESISYALFNKSSWAELRPLVSEHASAMSVDLTFAHDGQRWRVRRQFHSGTTPSIHVLTNLGSGERVDGASRVDEKIKSLVGMTYETFQAIVLLPQGRFDRLLTATDKERAVLLRDLFGTRMLESAKALATKRMESLKDLLHAAELVRKDLLADPDGAAREAEIASIRAGREADRLAAALSSLQAAQADAIRARDSGDALDSALNDLQAHAVKGWKRSIDELTALNAEYVRTAGRLTSQAEHAQKRAAEITDELARYQRQGLTEGTVSSARTFLAELPRDLADLHFERDRLADEQLGLDAEEQAVEADHARLEQLEREAQAAAAEAERHSNRGPETRAAVSALNDAVVATLVAAADESRARQEESRAGQALDGLVAALPALRASADKARQQLTLAREHLADQRRIEVIATAAAHLSPGHDPCPVCARRLPEDFQPSALAAPMELRSAQEAELTADSALRAADAELSRAVERGQDARTALEQQQNSAAQARRQLAETVAAVRRAYEAVSASLLLASPVSIDETEVFIASLRAAAMSLTSGVDRGAVATALLVPVRVAEDEMSDQVLASHKKAQSMAAKVGASLVALDARRSALHSATDRRDADKERLAERWDALTQRMRALPETIRYPFLRDVRKVSEKDVMKARDIAGDRALALRELSRQRDEARERMATSSRELADLDRERDAAVTRPLRALLTALERWAAAADRSAAVSDPAGTAARPAEPEFPTPESVAPYALSIAESAAEVHDTLHKQAEHSRELLLQLTGNLARQCRDLADQVVGLDPTGDLLAHCALYPLVAAQRSAHDTRQRAQSEKAEAESQIGRAATLDSAIEAGNARLDALTTVRRELGDSNFPAYVTELRTHALLGIASELFGQLSDGRFGFAKDFRIVSRATGVVRGPKTLSGGETFLGSLALALALVELHSRDGARIGALFLDEGFGSLDTGTLDTALSVLRGEAGDDRLVVVISHLRAVAEAVDDTLWVQRGPAGSVARWLSGRERDALVYQETDAGLLTLT